MSSRLRGSLFAGLGAFMIASLVVIGASAASTSHRAKSKFTNQDRAQIAKQAARGARTVSLLIATPRLGTASVAKNIGEIGGKVVYRNNKLGYIRVEVPIRKADQASRLSGIQAINFDAPDSAARSASGRPGARRPAATARCGHAARQPLHAHA